MSTIENLQQSYKFNRGRTLALLEQIEKEQPDARAVLGWRPGPGRAHIGWQLAHIGVTEEIFAAERLKPGKAAKFGSLWPRFRGGSTPDEDVPSADQLREILAAGRENLLDTLAGFSDAQLAEVPEALKDRGWRLLDVVHIISWHEGHHQGQAHLTYNLYKAAHAK